MTSHEAEIAKKIIPYLDQATADLKAGIVYRLQLARADALARLSDPQRIVGSELAHALAGAAGGNLAPRPTPRFNLRLWFGIALFAVVAGTKLPTCASTTMSPTWRSSVLFPAMFGPVRMMRRASAGGISSSEVT